MLELTWPIPVLILVLVILTTLLTIQMKPWKSEPAIPFICSTSHYQQPPKESRSCFREFSPFPCFETWLEKLSLTSNSKTVFITHVRAERKGRRDIFIAPSRRAFENAKDFLELPKNAHVLIEEIWNDSEEDFPLEEMCVDKFGITLSRRDLLKLKPMEWLNDEIINYFMQLVVQRSTHDPKLPKVFAFNSFFFTSLRNKGFSALRRWTKKINLFSFDIILIPIHDNAHWSLAVIDIQKQMINYYDSMLATRSDYIKILKEYIVSEYLDKTKSELPLEKWSFNIEKNIPVQLNGNDCGVFVCRFAEYISRRKEINFDQIHMRYFRRRMVYEICTGNLL